MSFACTLLFVCAALAAVSVAYANIGQFHPESTATISQQCAIARFAVAYAQSLQPPSTINRYNYTALTTDALQINQVCASEQAPTVYKVPPSTSSLQSTPQQSHCEREWFVDGTSGDDSYNGTRVQPFRTVHRAIRASRTAARSAYNRCIQVRAGVYYFGSTVTQHSANSRVGAISLTSTDSGLTIAAYADEQVTFSGGRLLTPTWSVYKNTSAGAIYVTKVADDVAVEWPLFNELYLDDWHAIRARYPNADPALQDRHTKPSGLIGDVTKWLYEYAETKPMPSVHINYTSPMFPGTVFPANNDGIAGSSASVFTPPRDFWSANSNPGYGHGEQYSVPYGMIYNTMSPNIKSWSNASIASGYWHIYHGSLWGNWIFHLGQVFINNQTVLFGPGGWQEARGRSFGNDFYVDNLLEELDYPTEWYLDTTNRLLYFMPNISAPMPKAIVASQRPCILSLRGDQSQPIRDVVISGITFTQTSNTYMSDYLAPSGGDWSLHTGGTVVITGAVNVTISDCTFTQIGTQAVVIVNYTEHVTVQNSHFVWTGDSAIIIQGRTQGINGVSSRDQPHNTMIKNNLIHETGMYVKQSSPVYHSLAVNTTITGVVAFNVPRAIININDGFAGGNIIEHNLFFNSVRDTGDHGPVNTWDRQPYLVSHDNNNMIQPTLIMRHNTIRYNFIISNYAAGYPVDHDDGSSYYDGYSNFLVYAGDKSYLGHNKQSYNNLFPYTSHSCYAFHALYDAAGWNETWYNNICIVGGTGNNHPVYSMSGCDTSYDIPKLVFTSWNNTFYLNDQTQQAMVSGCTNGQGQPLNLTISDWYQRFGLDAGSKVYYSYPSVDEIIQWAIQLLNN